MCHGHPPPHHLYLQFSRLVCFSNFLDQWRSITSNSFVLNMVQGHHLQLQSYPPLFCNLWQFNVKVATTHHAITEKDVDELLAMGVI